MELTNQLLDTLRDDIIGDVETQGYQDVVGTEVQSIQRIDADDRGLLADELAHFALHRWLCPLADQKPFGVNREKHRGNPKQDSDRQRTDGIEDMDTGPLRRTYCGRGNQDADQNRGIFEQDNVYCRVFQGAEILAEALLEREPRAKGKDEYGNHEGPEIDLGSIAEGMRIVRRLLRLAYAQQQEAFVSGIHQRVNRLRQHGRRARIHGCCEFTYSGRQIGADSRTDCG